MILNLEINVAPELDQEKAVRRPAVKEIVELRLRELVDDVTDVDRLQRGLDRPTARQVHELVRLRARMRRPDVSAEFQQPETSEVR